MSTLYVDTINEKTSGNGIYIPGHVLQVVQYQKTDLFSTSSTSFVDVTDFELSITPASSSSKILINCCLLAHHDGNLQDEFRFQRKTGSGSFENFGSVPSNRVMFTSGYYGSNTSASANLIFLDSPATTSQLTYKLQARTRHSQTLVVGDDWNSDDAGINVLILMEIGG
jgi:hypothetical protein